MTCHGCGCRCVGRDAVWYRMDGCCGACRDPDRGPPWHLWVFAAGSAYLIFLAILVGVFG